MDKKNNSLFIIGIMILIVLIVLVILIIILLLNNSKKTNDTNTTTNQTSSIPSFHEYLEQKEKSNDTNNIESDINNNTTNTIINNKTDNKNSTTITTKTIVVENNDNDYNYSSNNNQNINTIKGTKEYYCTSNFELKGSKCVYVLESEPLQRSKCNEGTLSDGKCKVETVMDISGYYSSYALEKCVSLGGGGAYNNCVCSNSGGTFDSRTGACYKRTTRSVNPTIEYYCIDSMKLENGKCVKKYETDAPYRYTCPDCCLLHLFNHPTGVCFIPLLVLAVSVLSLWPLRWCRH